MLWRSIPPSFSQMLHEKGRGFSPAILLSSNAEQDLIAASHQIGKVAVYFGLNPRRGFRSNVYPLWKLPSVFEPT